MKTPNSAAGVKTPSRTPDTYETPELAEAARILERYGGDPSRGPSAGRAAERFFTRLQGRFSSLVGSNGYRSLLEQAHARAVEKHPVLERWGVRREGEPFFDRPKRGGSSMHASDTDVWNGLVALTGEFLTLSNALGRGNEAGGDAGRATRQARGQEQRRAHEPWRIFVLDRDLATCQAMARALDEARDFHVERHALTVAQVKESVPGTPVDFVVASGHLPSEDVLDLCRWSRDESPGDPPHVVVTGLPHDDALVLRLMEAGAAGFTMGEFSVEGLRMTLRLLARGESVFSLRLQHMMAMRLSELAELVRDRGLNPESVSSLTPREKDVLELLAEDLTNRQIARRLYISEGTVKSHVHQILRKLKVRDRHEAVRVLRLRDAADS